MRVYHLTKSQETSDDNEAPHHAQQNRENWLSTLSSAGTGLYTWPPHLPKEKIARETPPNKSRFQQRSSTFKPNAHRSRVCAPCCLMLIFIHSSLALCLLCVLTWPTLCSAKLRSKCQSLLSLICTASQKSILQQSPSRTMQNAVNFYYKKCIFDSI